MADPNRSISFTMEGDDKNPSLVIEVIELADGTLHFEYEVSGDSELRGLFFDFNNSEAINSLRVVGAQITNQSFADDGVTNLKDGNNILGSGAVFDAGVSLGYSGSGQDQTKTGTFVLSTDNGSPLSLDDIANVEFGARFSGSSYKLIAFAPAAPDANDDAIVTNEDSATDESLPNANLLADDTDADGDQLTVVAINGNGGLVGTQFDLATGGLVTVNSDGTFDLDPNGMYEDLAVGESRKDSFTYRITDELVDPDNQGFDTATVEVTITGLNDKPIISIEGDDSDGETVVETNGNLATTGSLTVSDVDLTDVVTASVFSVTTGGEDTDISLPDNPGLLSMMGLNPQAPNVLLDNTEVTGSLAWNFSSGGEAFNYLADDEFLTLDYTIRAVDDNGALDDQLVRITVDGTNDRPVAQNVSGVVGEDDASVTVNFDASDLDSSDNLSFVILGQPTDAQGRQYGAVTNNDDGSFTFSPLDNFQFLEAGESRDVTFQYQAVDDSGTASAISVAKTATITVNGAYDEPISLTPELVFETSDQSMWDSGPADEFDIDFRDFYGVEWKREEASFNKSIIGQKTLTVVPKLYWEVLGETVLDYGGYSIKTPSLSLDAGTSGRIGVSPYFMLDSGSVDSTVPIDVSLTYAVQFEDSDKISIATGYTLDDAATFNTFSPTITFGMDLVFEFAADATFSLGSSSFGGGKNWEVFDFSINYDEAEPIDKWASSGDGDTANLLNFSSVDGLTSDFFSVAEEPEPGDFFSFVQNDGVYTISGGDSSLELSLPYIETTGSPTGEKRLTNPHVEAQDENGDTFITGEDDVAILNLDLDQILSETFKKVPPMRWRADDLDPPPAVTFKIPDAIVDTAKTAIDVAEFFGVDVGNNTSFLDKASINLITADWDFELIDVDLIGTLTAVQDFTLDIQNIPLLLTLENGDEITGFKLGDTIEFDLPDWDVDAMGDMDGQMDYTISLDMDALFNNWTTLDFSLDLLARALKADIDITSDIFSDFSYDLTDKNEGFLYSKNYSLIDEDPLAELFGDVDPAESGFDFGGWNTLEYVNELDIA